MVSTRKAQYTAPPAKPKRKVRNKVASPVAKARPSIESRYTGEELIAYNNREAAASEEAGYTSDEFDFKDQEDPDEQKSDVGSEVSSVTSPGLKKSRKKLPFNLRKQLLIDIQRSGGIAVFKLQAPQAVSLLCDKNKALYGDRGDPLRDPIRKKVHQWYSKYKNSENDWLEVLKDHQVTEKPKGSRAVKESGQQSKPAGTPKSSSEEPEEQGGLPGTEIVVPKRTQAQQQTQTRLKAAPTQAIKPATPAPSASRHQYFVSTDTTTTASAKLPSVASARLPDNMSTGANTTVVMANPAKPEMNGEFLIYPIPDFVGVDGSTEYKGFYILLRMDTRFPLMDDQTSWYSAKVISPTQLLFQMPAWPFQLWPTGQYQSVLYEKFQEAINNRSVTKAMNAAHSVFDAKDGEEMTAEMEGRKWKYVLMDFANVKGIGELSSKVLYDEAGEQEVLEYDIVPVPLNFDVDENSNFKVLTQEIYLGFKVASVGDSRKIARKTAKKSKLAEKLASMATNQSGNTSATRTTTQDSKPSPVPSSIFARSAAVPSHVPSTFPMGVGSSGRSQVDEEGMLNTMANNTDDDNMSTTDFEAERQQDREFEQNLDGLIAEGIEMMDESRDVKRSLQTANEPSQSGAMRAFEGASRLLRGQKGHKK